MTKICTRYTKISRFYMRAIHVLEFPNISIAQGELVTYESKLDHIVDTEMDY